jgi:hypothetical protein
MTPCKLILEAFAELKRPGERLTTHHCDECDEVDAALRGRSWQEVASNFPIYCHDAFPLLTEDAQRYFLPPYMLAALRPDASMQGTSLENVLADGRLSPENVTTAQRAAIVAWMMDYWMATYEEPPPAELLSKWSTQSAD